MRTVGEVESIGRSHGPSPPESGPAVRDRGAALFVWAAWALMMLAALWFVGRFGGRVPYYDDWSDVPVLCGQEPLTGAYLWAQHAEHRIPLPKLIFVALAKLSGCDFRAGLVFNVVVLGTVAFALILAARRLRGRMSYADAFFPLALLSLGQYETFLISHAVDLVTGMALAGAILVAIAWHPRALPPGALLVAGVCVSLLTLCGAIGLALVPALVVWLGCVAVAHWRSPGPHRRGHSLLAGGLAAAALLLLGLYFVGWQKPPSEEESPTCPGLRFALRTGVEFLSMGFGPAAKAFWPVSGLGVLVVGLSGLAALALAGWRQPAERLRALGLFLFLGGLATLALAVGWGRSGYGPGAAFQARYLTYTAPVLCGVYLAWGLCRPPELARFAQTCLFTLTALMFSLNTSLGLNHGYAHRQQMDAFEHDLQAGMPADALAQRHGRFLFPWPPSNPDTEYLAARLRLLHRAAVGPFRYLADDPVPVEVPLPVVPAATSQMTWANGTGQAWGEAPHLVFALAQPRRVYGVRLRYAVTLPQPLAPAAERLRVFWKRGSQEPFARERSYWIPLREPEPAEKTVTIWIWDEIEQLRIDPAGGPCTLQLAELVLLVPALSEFSREPPASAGSALAGGSRLNGEVIRGRALSRPRLVRGSQNRRRL
jgi:hypothetical protein